MMILKGNKKYIVKYAQKSSAAKLDKVERLISQEILIISESNIRTRYRSRRGVFYQGRDNYANGFSIDWAKGNCPR